jgi:uncharacterized protein with HEPN domain
MSERHYRLYLNDILESGHAIQLYVEGVTYDIFCRERMRISAVVREFEIIGEAVGKLPETIKANYPDVPWREVKDFRNMLIHEYFGVDLQIIWNTIQMDLPLLLKASESALAKDSQSIDQSAL